MGNEAQDFVISCRWLNNAANDAENATMCELKITVGSHVVTRNFNEEDRQENDYIIVSAWPIAAWLADSWWRLIYETGPGITRQDHISIDWEMAHCLPTAGYGYLWPPLLLVSNDKYIQAHLYSDVNDEIRLASFTSKPDSLIVKPGSFAITCRDFLNKVQERLRERFPNDPLRSLISQLFVETDDPDLAQYRIIEAVTGYDPDQAPPELVKNGWELIQQFGQSFFKDIASAINRSFIADADPVDSLAKLRQTAETVGKNGIRGKFTLGQHFTPEEGVFLAPWEHGRRMARDLRKKLGLKPETCIDSNLLRDWFEISNQMFKNGQSCGESGLCRKKEDETLKFRFADESSWYYSRNRRFFLARLTAACLKSKHSPAWLALGPGTTWNQKMQRAFAAELLAPVAGIQSLYPDLHSLDRTAAEKLARHYDVTLFTIVHSLANQKEISLRHARELAA